MQQWARSSQFLSMLVLRASDCWWLNSCWKDELFAGRKCRKAWIWKNSFLFGREAPAETSLVAVLTGFCNTITADTMPRALLHVNTLSWAPELNMMKKKENRDKAWILLIIRMLCNINVRQLATACAKGMENSRSGKGLETFWKRSLFVGWLLCMFLAEKWRKWKKGRDIGIFYIVLL